MKLIIENINELMDSSKLKQVYDSLKKGDEINITYDNAISKGLNKTLKVVKDKTKVGSKNVERITLVNVSNPTGMKYYFYNRDGRISFATGDMGAVVKNISEGSELTTENKATEYLEDIANFLESNQHHFAQFLKPKRLNTLVNDNKLIVRSGSGSFTLSVDGNKKVINTTGKPAYPESVSYTEILEYLKRKTAFKFMESMKVTEGDTEPQIITQLRDVIKSGYKSLKDPKSGRKLKVDTFSASAIVRVYDGLNDINKKKFSELGLIGMQNVAFKILNK